VERILSLKETCRLRAVSTYHVLVDAISSFFCGQQPDLAWLPESAHTALNFHPVIAYKS
jgi:transposase